MSIEAMKLALEALENAAKDATDYQSIDLDETGAAISLIRTAIQQAEAQQVENSTGTGEPVVQAGLTDDQLREAFAEKLSDIDPNEHDMTIFALGAEVGAGELAAERQMARMYFDERNSARDAWRRAADERDQLKATTEPVHQIRKAFSQDAEWAWRDATEELFHMHPKEHRRILYTCPAPSVPDDVVRDAERYRWLRLALVDREKGVSHHFCSIRYSKELDEAIDAAMLAAK